MSSNWPPNIGLITRSRVVTVRPGNQHEPWTDEQDQLLRERWATCPPGERINLFPGIRTRQACESRANKLRLKCELPPAPRDQSERRSPARPGREKKAPIKTALSAEIGQHAKFVVGDRLYCGLIEDDFGILAGKRRLLMSTIVDVPLDTVLLT